MRIAVLILILLGLSQFVAAAPYQQHSEDRDHGRHKASALRSVSHSAPLQKRILGLNTLGRMWNRVGSGVGRLFGGTSWMKAAPKPETATLGGTTKVTSGFNFFRTKKPTTTVPPEVPATPRTGQTTAEFSTSPPVQPLARPPTSPRVQNPAGTEGSTVAVPPTSPRVQNPAGTEGSTVAVPPTTPRSLPHAETEVSTVNTPRLDANGNPIEGQAKSSLKKWGVRAGYTTAGIGLVGVPGAIIYATHERQQQRQRAAQQALAQGQQQNGYQPFQAATVSNGFAPQPLTVGGGGSQTGYGTTPQPYVQPQPYGQSTNYGQSANYVQPQPYGQSTSYGQSTNYVKRSEVAEDIKHAPVAPHAASGHNNVRLVKRMGSSSAHDSFSESGGGKGTDGAGTDDTSSSSASTYYPMYHDDREKKEGDRALELKDVIYATGKSGKAAKLDDHVRELLRIRKRSGSSLDEEVGHSTSNPKEADEEKSLEKRAMPLSSATTGFRNPIPKVWRYRIGGGILGFGLIESVGLKNFGTSYVVGAPGNANQNVLNKLQSMNIAVDSMGRPITK